MVAALNGKAVDWPQQFYRELTGELSTLHTKHGASHVKLSKTTIGPHITLILRAAKVLDIREEFEAGYRTPKALTITEQAPLPTRKKAKAQKGAGTQPNARVPTPPNLGSTEAQGPPHTPTAPIYAAILQAAKQVKDTPQRGRSLPTTEHTKPPKILPPMVEQICQGNRRLENLLVSFTSKAPKKFINQMNSELFKFQREETLIQHKDQPGAGHLDVFLHAQEAQLQQLATQLANSEGLNEINIETIFHLEEEVATLQQKWDHAQEEILSWKALKGETTGKLKHLQDKLQDKIQHMRTKDKEIAHLNTRITEMSGML